jgi:hypothetical protein
VPTSGCSFVPGIAQLDGPYTVRFENPDNAVGGFSVVTDVDPLATWDAGVTDPNSLPACDDPAAGPGDPCNTYAVWNATVTTEYYTDRLSYSNTQNVTVYEGA